MEARGSAGAELLPRAGSAGTVPAGEAAGLKPRAVFSPGSARLAGALGCSGAAALLPARSPRAPTKPLLSSLQAPQGPPLQPVRTEGRKKILCLPGPKKLFSQAKSHGGQRAAENLSSEASKRPRSERGASPRPGPTHGPSRAPGA